MQIGSGISSFSSVWATATAALSSQGASSAAAASNASANSAQSNGSITSYDFTATTPSQMQGIAQSMYNSGKIDLTQLFKLQNIGVPFGKSAPDGSLVSLSASERSDAESKPTDYLGTISGILEQIKQTYRVNDPTSGYQSWQDLLTQLKGMQGEPSSADITV